MGDHLGLRCNATRGRLMLQPISATGDTPHGVRANSHGHCVRGERRHRDPRSREHPLVRQRGIARYGLGGRVVHSEITATGIHRSGKTRSLLDPPSFASRSRTPSNLPPVSAFVRRSPRCAMWRRRRRPRGCPGERGSSRASARRPAGTTHMAHREIGAPGLRTAVGIRAVLGSQRPRAPPKRVRDAQDPGSRSVSNRRVRLAGGPCESPRPGRVLPAAKNGSRPQTRVMTVLSAANRHQLARIAQGSRAAEAGRRSR